MIVRAPLAPKTVFELPLKAASFSNGQVLCLNKYRRFGQCPRKGGSPMWERLVQNTIRLDKGLSENVKINGRYCGLSADYNIVNPNTPNRSKRRGFNS